MGTGATAPAVQECTPDMYVDASAENDSRVIDVSGVAALAYTPACLIIKAGQSVTFEGSMSAHPLAPGEVIAGSPASPIQETTSGSSVEFTFPEKGAFSYYCTIHGDAQGKFMAGVVYVIE